ncbi:hypothetical protein D3C76_572730 [compost metagenome]
MQQVIRVTKQPLGLDDLRDFPQRRFEIRDRLTGDLAQRDEHQRREVEPQRGRCQARVVAEDSPGLLQRLEPTMAGRQAQAHTVGQLGHRQATVFLQLGKDLSVSSVH